MDHRVLAAGVDEQGCAVACEREDVTPGAARSRPGRDFHLRPTATLDVLRIEVTDTRTEQVPPASVREVPGDAESGRGLLLVARPATRWGTAPRPTAPGKIIWAELISETSKAVHP